MPLAISSIIRVTTLVFLFFLCPGYGRRARVARKREQGRSFEACVDLQETHDVAFKCHFLTSFSEKGLVRFSVVNVFELLLQSPNVVSASPRPLYEFLTSGVNKMPKAEGLSYVALPAEYLEMAEYSLCQTRERTGRSVLIRFLICPLLSCAVACSTLFKDFESRLLKAFPGFPFFGFLLQASSTAPLLPPIPTSYLQAFDLGIIVEKLRQLSPGTTKYNSVLAEAAKLMGRTMSEADINAIRSELEKMLLRSSITQQVMGFFSLVNLVWLGAIFGIVISVGPVCWLLAKPLQELLAPLFARLANIMKEATKWFLEKLVVPTLTALHHYSVFEVLAHLVALTLYLHALRVPENGVGAHIAISGIAALLGATFYSMVVVRPKLAFNMLPDRLRYFLAKVVFPLYPAVFCVPAAIAHQSLLLGFASTASLLSALGFGVAAYPFCYCVGWDSEDEMVRTTAACGVGLAAFINLHLFEVDFHYMKPFVAPVSVLGGMGHYLGLLICSNAWYQRRHPGKNVYLKYNTAMVVSLLASLVVGNTLGMEGLKNTAITFGVLWVVDKTRELQECAKLNAWCLVFGGSIAAYFAALWLHANHAFVVSMFTAVASD